jgi:hypothetical protein
MKLRLMFFFFMVLISFYAIAQKEKPKFNSINTIGIVKGEIGSYTIFQTVNGLQYKKWYAGIGAGYDNYYYKSIPLFFDIRRFFGKQNNFLIYGDAGYNFPYKSIPKESSSYSLFHFSGNFYSDVGFGYKIKLIKKTSFIITTGYSYKKLSDKVEVITPYLVGPSSENIYNYNYTFRRIIIKAGIMF